MTRRGFRGPSSDPCSHAAARRSSCRDRPGALSRRHPSGSARTCLKIDVVAVRGLAPLGARSGITGPRLCETKGSGALQVSADVCLAAARALRSFLAVAGLVSLRHSCSSRRVAVFPLDLSRRCRRRLRRRVVCALFRGRWRLRAADLASAPSLLVSTPLPALWLSAGATAIGVAPRTLLVARRPRPCRGAGMSCVRCIGLPRRGRLKRRRA